jgi:hypothetical protein
MKNETSRRQFNRAIAIGVAFLILCTPSISLGWGAGGHMMVASIAFSLLNPRAKAQAQTLLAIAINPAAVSISEKQRLR